MRCLKCIEEDRRSTVHFEGTPTIPAVFFRPYYDEGGKFIDVPPEKVTLYTCSNGHKWSESK